MPAETVTSTNVADGEAGAGEISVKVPGGITVKSSVSVTVFVDTGSPTSETVIVVV